MSAPTPPTPPELDPVISFTHKLRDEFDLILSRYHVAIFLMLCAFAFAAYGGWTYHVKRLARLEAQASIEKTRATNEKKLADAWRTRALAKVDSFRVDTVRVAHVITRTKTITVEVPVHDSDGVTYSVPMAVVAKLDFDSLGAACERTQHDCASALAAKDSVIAHQDSARAALVVLNANTAKQLTMQKHTTFWSKWGYAIAGVVIGRVTARGIR